MILKKLHEFLSSNTGKLTIIIAAIAAFVIVYFSPIFILLYGIVNSYSGDDLSEEITETEYLYEPDELPFKLKIKKIDKKDFMLSSETTTVEIQSACGDKSQFTVFPKYRNNLVCLYIHPDTLYILIDLTIYAQSAFSSGDRIKDIKEGKIKIVPIYRDIFKDVDGKFYEQIQFKPFDFESHEITLMDFGSKKYIYHPKFSNYDYMIVMNESFDKLWVYDSNDSIIYRSESLINESRRAPYLYKRIEQAIL